MTGEIISVGTELLMGMIVNTDAQYLANELNKYGFNLYHPVHGGRQHGTAWWKPLRPPWTGATCSSFRAAGADRRRLDQRGGGQIPGLAHGAGRAGRKGPERLHGAARQDHYAQQLPPGRVPGRRAHPQKFLRHGARLRVRDRRPSSSPCCPAPRTSSRPCSKAAWRPCLKSVWTANSARATSAWWAWANRPWNTRSKTSSTPRPTPPLRLTLRWAKCALRVTAAVGKDEDPDALVEPVVQKICERLGDYVYSTHGVTLPRVVEDLLKQQQKTISVAESERRADLQRPGGDPWHVRSAAGRRGAVYR